MTIEQWLSDVCQDAYVGTNIWNKEKDGGSQLVAEVRGWGAIQYLFKTNEEAKQFQNDVGDFIVQAIREKLARVPQQELYTEEQVREAIDLARRNKEYSFGEGYEFTKEEIIKSIKN